MPIGAEFMENKLSKTLDEVLYASEYDGFILQRSHA